MKTTQYSSMRLSKSYITKDVSYLYLTNPNHNVQRLVMFHEDGDTLFFLDNSVFMNVNYITKVPNHLKLVYKP